MFHTKNYNTKGEKMKYKCSVCQWIYDEEKEGKNFDELPDDWTCPLCGAGKDMFDKIDE